MPPIAILVALADPTRCRLIELLLVGPRPVHVLAAAFKISRPAISRHLRVLKQSGLISENKFGRENRYSLHPAKLAPVQRWLTGIVPPPKGGPDAAAAVAPVAETVAKPQAKRAGARVPDATVVVPAPPVDAVHPEMSKPKKPAAISQMGFDF
ncbi:MAG: ArsR/SmtB family transcription factor [Devosia sp.]